MSTEVLGRRYAKAIFDIARGEQLVESLQGDLEKIWDAWRAQPDLPRVLGHEKFPRKQRLRVIDGLGELLQLKTLTINFMKVLVEKRRLDCFASIVTAFQKMSADRAGIVSATVTTATPLLNSGVLSQIKATLGKVMAKQVQIATDVDRRLIGGVVIRIGDEVYDGSIARGLQRMRERLLKAE